MIGTAQAIVLGNAVGHRGAAMRAALGHEPHVTEVISIQSEVLTEQADLLNWLSVELEHGRDRMPVTAQQVPHRGPRADLRQALVCFLCKHRSSPWLLFLRTYVADFGLSNADRRSRAAGNPERMVADEGVALGLV